ncbi:MAG: hypothetical protein KDK71_09155, partial [Chlamydiia bacterium]|nr:hypothetical protein [Chlamydiia bacterium]
YDQKYSKSSIRKLTHQKLNEFELIIGCTGKPSLSEDQIKALRKDTCLVSVSSSDREFRGVFLRKNVDEILNCHQDVFSKGVYLLNCGFPINFDDAYAEIDIEEFQLTRAILLAGLLQACELGDQTGLIPLHSFLQTRIYGNYSEKFLKNEKVIATCAT